MFIRGRYVRETRSRGLNETPEVLTDERGRKGSREKGQATFLVKDLSNFPSPETRNVPGLFFHSEFTLIKCILIAARSAKKLRNTPSGKFSSHCSLTPPLKPASSDLSRGNKAVNARWHCA